MEAEPGFVTVGVLLLLDPATRAASVARSAAYASLATEPRVVLDDGPASRCLPHISLFHLDVAPADAPRLVPVLAALSAASPGVAGRFEAIAPRGAWLFWTTPRTPALDAVADAVVRAVAPLRARDTDISWAMSDAQRAMHRAWGYPNCGACFDPHVTLSVVGAVPDDLPRPDPWPWSSPALALARMGPRGTAAELLWTGAWGAPPG